MTTDEPRVREGDVEVRARLVPVPDATAQPVSGTRLGVLDIGSNSAQLQIVDLRHGAPPLPAYAVKHPVLLGEEIGDDNMVSQTGIDRVVQACCASVDEVEKYRVDLLYVFATAAIRDAANRDEILDRIEAAADVRPQYLGGEDEARLTYLAAHRWYGWSANRILLLDIGGGSMEIALGRDAEPELAVSLPLGAGRLTRDFLPDDPPSRAQLRDLRRHIRTTVREVTDRVRWEGPPGRAVATSKTFKQLARLTGSAPQRKGPFVRRQVDVRDLRHWIPRLAELPAAKRADLPGVSASRARQILAGALVAKLTMSALDIRVADVCPWALREGIMLHYLQTAQGESWAMPLHHTRPGSPPPGERTGLSMAHRAH